MPDRSALRQPRLVSAMLTCKLFHSICVPLLYSDIVTDRFDILLYSASQPKQRHLYSHTRSLRIEYCHKELEPTYLAIFEGRSRFESYRPREFSEFNDALAANDEAVRLEAALKALSVKKRHMRTIFPALQSIAVSSIYGKDGMVSGEHGHTWFRQWNLFRLGGRRLADVQSCHARFEAFLASGDVRHLCIREAGDPLSLTYLTLPHMRSMCANPRTTTTVHFGRMMDRLPITLGTPIRWVSDLGPSEDWADNLSGHDHWDPARTSFGPAFNYCINHRKSLIDSDQRYRRTPLVLEIFFSTDYFGRECLAEDMSVFGMTGMGVPPQPPVISPMRKLTLSLQQMMAGRLGAILQKFSREQITCPTDSITWRTSAESPICPACGSGPPA